MRRHKCSILFARFIIAIGVSIALGQAIVGIGHSVQPMRSASR